MKKIIKQRIKESISTKSKLLQDEKIIDLVEKISLAIIDSFDRGGKLILAGNGGSLADSFHLAGEFVSRFKFDRKPLPAVALGANNIILTAIGNDYSFENIFYREIEAIGKKDDIFIAISTSGNSKNIIRALKKAQIMGIKTFGLTGKNKNQMQNICECIQVPSKITARIQEAHIMIGHIICELVENKMFLNK